MILIVESVIGCILFSVIVMIPVYRNPLFAIHDYPPAIIQRVKELGLIDEKQEPLSKQVIIKKLIASICIAVILGWVLVYINKCKSFVDAFFTSYLLWNIVNWYDALIIDCVWFCHSQKIIIDGTQDMIDDYHDYMFHIKGGFKGMIIGLPVVLLVAIAVQIIA